MFWTPAVLGLRASLTPRLNEASRPSGSWGLLLLLLLLLFIQPFQQYMTIQKILADGLGETKAK